ncbi:MAG: glutamate 5-kinase [bacterium]|nr:glutamate 5-kinase [bacterium]MDE0668971.1 glutamate 5-kinase [bacterium]MXZ31769.1 glutamate 5-kinase [Acidimicrobiia bacterium]MYB23733.1 glutamate 5-kinase [Acidimicrobiia bacterium]MYJ14703.1 glutamate 5-kinase [Acidimicrobiia bacterium]
MILVVKIGTSSLVDESGHVDTAEIRRLCGLLAELRSDGQQVLLVTSAAITAGRWLLGFDKRPTDPVQLQASSAVGQGHLMAMYNDAFAAVGLVAGQILLTPLDFFERSRYLRVRDTLRCLLSLGVVPVINENDAVADDEIAFGDNDRIAALVAQLVQADLLVLLTDIEGLHTADPRLSQGTSLIAEIQEIDRELEAAAGGVGNADARGGMASKLSAARIASWAGVPTMIASARRPGVLRDAAAGKNVGTLARPRAQRLGARKLWIAFAVRSVGRLTVDAGARRALVKGGKSLLAVGVRSVSGEFVAGDAVEVAGPEGDVFAKGLVRMPSARLDSVIGRRSSEHEAGTPEELIHRDDMVLLAP